MSDRGADHVRYGVFLTPDPRTSAAVTTVTSLVRAQFGLVSAGRFPPHATLVGSLPVEVTEDELVAVVARTVGERRSFPVHNVGVRRLRSALIYDVHDLDGGPNAALVDLAGALDAAVRPLLRPAPGLAPDVHDGGLGWHGHLSLASHELNDRPDLRDEVEAFVLGLDVPFPSAFTATTVTVYRQTHPTWTGAWWEDFRWTYVRALRLGSPGR